MSLRDKNHLCKRRKTSKNAVHCDDLIHKGSFSSKCSVRGRVMPDSIASSLFGDDRPVFRLFYCDACRRERNRKIHDFEDEPKLSCPTSFDFDDEEPFLNQMKNMNAMQVFSYADIGQGQKSRRRSAILQYAKSLDMTVSDALDTAIDATLENSALFLTVYSTTREKISRLSSCLEATKCLSATEPSALLSLSSALFLLYGSALEERYPQRI